MRKNKLFPAVLAATTLTLSISASACAPYYPLEEFDTSGISQEGLNHFKKVLKDSNLFEEDSLFAIQVGAHAGDWVATIFILDSTGKEIDRYFTADDEFEYDVLSALYDGLYTWEYSEDFYYEYDLRVSKNKIYGSRTLPYGWQERLEKAETQLILAGYPDSIFTYEDGKFSYGEYKVSGHLAEDMKKAAFYKGIIWDAYRTKLEDGTILTERVY